MTSILPIVARRLALGLLTLFAVSLIIFPGVELLSGDLAQTLLGKGAPPEAVAALRKKLDLDLPAYVRYLNWLAGILQGDFGKSLIDQRAVSELIGMRAQNTLFLAIVTAAMSVPLAVSLGLLAAVYRKSIFDRAANLTTVSSISAPEFFLAYILILIFSIELGWFSPMSPVNPDTAFWDRLNRTFLPALTLTLVLTAHMMRMTRASITNLLASPDIEATNLKGLTKAGVIVHHALPPIIKAIVINLSCLVVGVIVVETVFVYPGLGQLMVDSVLSRDIPVVQACCMILAGAYIIMNMAADILSIVTDPHPRRLSEAALADKTQPPEHGIDAQTAAPGRRHNGLRDAVRDPAKVPLSAKFGIVVIIGFTFITVFAPLLAPYGETEIASFPFDESGGKYLLGTDNLGRDTFSRLLYGARNTIGIAFLTTCLAFLLGGFVSVLATTMGGWADRILSRIVDILAAIPLLIFAMLLLTIFGTSVLTLVIVIAVLDSTRVFQRVRAVSMNAVALIAGFGLRFCFVFLTITTLSFLGLGIQPPAADWGVMVKANIQLMMFGDVTPLMPATAIALLAISVNFVVDWLLDKSGRVRDHH